MIECITEGVKVSVKTTFRGDLSRVDLMCFVYEYKVLIENKNLFPVQLIHRDWLIFDTLNEPKYVSGAGVVGEQPVLEPGEVYSYSSASEIQSEIGYMRGFYTFVQLENKQQFQVKIPRFQLIYGPKLN